MMEKREVAGKYIQKGYPVRKVIGLVGIAPGSYYRKPSVGARGRPQSTTTADIHGGMVADPEVVGMIESVLAMKWVDYGYHKVTRWLQDEKGLRINRKKVLRLMQQHALTHGLRMVAKPQRLHAQGCSPMPSGPGLHFELDIIHLWMPASSRHVLLLNCIDLFHREWTEFALGWSITHKDVIRVVERLVGKGCTKVVIRTDNGGQFSAGALADALQQMGVTHEFIRPATPQQNAHVESLHATLRKVLPDFSDFKGIDDLRSELQAFRAFYNNKRLHSATCYYPPMVFLRKWEDGLIQEKLDKHNHRKFLRAKGDVSPPVSEAILVGGHNDKP
jgi:putative transposase